MRDKEKNADDKEQENTEKRKELLNLKINR